MNTETLQERLRKRALIRSGITSRKSIQENKPEGFDSIEPTPDRISELLVEAADNIQSLLAIIEHLNNQVNGLNHELDDMQCQLDYIERSREY